MSKELSADQNKQFLLVMGMVTFSRSMIVISTSIDDRSSVTMGLLNVFTDYN
jgi:hypothetical protein